jgi:hypothetical protein
MERRVPMEWSLLQIKRKKTKTIQNSLDPVFNEPFTIDIGDASHFSIVIQDKASPGNDDFMGQVVIPVNGLRLDGSNNWFPLKEKEKSKKVGVKGEVLLQFAVPPPTGKALTPSASQEKEAKKFMDTSLKSGKQTVELEGLQLQALPKDVYEKCQNFTQFNLGFNSFVEWPNLAPFLKLTILNLSGNKLVSISPSISLLTNLRELYLNGNNLKALPPEIGECYKLEKLSIANNQLRKLVDDIGYLVKLEELNLTGNHLTTVPPTMGECISMEILDLSCCELESLPEEFTFMTRVLELNLGSNKLTQLPETIGRMTRLTILNLSDNLLQDLPLSLGLCFSLGKLGAGINLDRNPIKSEEMYKKWKIGTDHLMDFLEKRYDRLGSPPLKQINRTLLKPKHPPPEPKEPKEQPKKGSGNSFLNSPQQPPKPQPPPTPQPPPPQQPDPLAEKIRVLANWARNTITTEIDPKLTSLIDKIQNTNSMDEAVSIGQLVTDMKEDCGKMKALVQGCGVTPPNPIHPNTAGITDKLQVLRITIGNALKEIMELLECVKQAVAYGTQQQVVSLVQIVKGINARLPPP